MLLDVFATIPTRPLVRARETVEINKRKFVQTKKLLVIQRTPATEKAFKLVIELLDIPLATETLTFRSRSFTVEENLLHDVMFLCSLTRSLHETLCLVLNPERVLKANQILGHMLKRLFEFNWS